MKQGSHRLSRDILGDVRSQFEDWRRSRTRGTPIPEDLWQGAVEAAQEHSVSKAARVLRLDYYRLKKRLEAAPDLSRPEPVDGRGFLEIPLCAPSAPECVLEIEDAQGARLRVELKGPAAAEMETLARALWSVAR